MSNFGGAWHCSIIAVRFAPGCIASLITWGAYHVNSKPTFRAAERLVALETLDAQIASVDGSALAASSLSATRLLLT